MARSKQKWTSEEEEALSAGVEKHGLGRWKTILSDPQFATSLANRSNVDLKDKWRNLGGNDGGSSSRRRYKAMIYEALSSIGDPNGTDISTLINYIEARYEVPRCFRRSFTSKIKKLVAKGNLEEMDERYKIKEPPFDAETSQQEDVDANNVDDHNAQAQQEPQTSGEPLPTETPEEAARVAAYRVSVAENMRRRMIKACKKEAKLTELLDESVTMLELAEDIHERCSRGGVVYLDP